MLGHRSTLQYQHRDLSELHDDPFGLVRLLSPSFAPIRLERLLQGGPRFRRQTSYRRIAALLRNAGWAMNLKGVERIWRREWLKVLSR